MRQSPIFSVLALLLLVVAVPTANAATVQVTVHNFEFDPATVNIQAGDTVVWTNTAGIHSVTSDDGTSFSVEAKAAPWTFSHTFPAAGNFPYHCEVHSFMTGTVNVTGGGSGGDQHGSLKLEQTSYSVQEGESVAVRVLRLNGDDGPVSVSYSVAAGTASASDFTAASGTLSWADGNDDVKTVTVVTKEDAAAEGNETVTVTLSNATGGATIDNAGKAATVTIQDDDAGGGPPSVPGNLQAHAHSTTEVMLTWTDSNGETGYRIEMKTLGGTFQQVASAGQNETSAVVGGLAPATGYVFRVRAENGSGVSAFSNEASASTDAPVAPCVPDATTLCLNNGRFEVRTHWRSASQSGDAAAVALDFAPDSGLFYFFSPTNIEMLVKVLNACVPALGNKYWVFYAATTNVELTVTVIDTQTGRTRVYYNPLGTAALPQQDTSAFATCP
ncbi:MAG TPA: fibronectin type III domain-containing protein [Thermoanaerobaculia bacterium]|jgi:plastocyanin|nr:fibronectin type III domain-containing protein [Thermoanaerobaculia bacterium]